MASRHQLFLENSFSALERAAAGSPETFELLPSPALSPRQMPQQPVHQTQELEEQGIQA